MSETIQSISNGTYTLGDTNKLTFSAGPGIVIDEPSEGTVRIGNDETVLWSGTYSGTVSTANFITLSERPDNFETIEITNGPGYYSKYRYDGNSNAWSFMQTYADSTACTVYAVRLSVDKANKKVYCANANFFKTKANAVIDWANQSTRSVGENMITKIVGINRISGSNA